VAKGERFTIMRNGAPIAMLVPTFETKRTTVEEAIAGIRELRKGVRPLGELTIRDLIDEGRRF